MPDQDTKELSEPEKRAYATQKMILACMLQMDRQIVVLLAAMERWMAGEWPKDADPEKFAVIKDSAHRLHEVTETLCKTCDGYVAAERDTSQDTVV